MSLTFQRKLIGVNLCYFVDTGLALTGDEETIRDAAPSIAESSLPKSFVLIGGINFHRFSFNSSKSCGLFVLIKMGLIVRIFFSSPLKSWKYHEKFETWVAAIDMALKKLRREASKRQSTLEPATLEFAKYIILFTTLPHEKFSTLEILDWYRLRWQIELVFKRLKSLTAFGHLPKYDDVSARAWLYGKLFVGLLTEKLIHSARVISPWGYCLQGENEKQVARI